MTIRKAGIVASLAALGALCGHSAAGAAGVEATVRSATPARTPAVAGPKAPKSALTVARQSITLAGARVAVDAVVAEAERRGVGAAVAVVDEGGHVVAVERVGGTIGEGSGISQGKARNAVVFQKPTAVFERVIRDGRQPMVPVDAGF